MTRTRRQGAMKRAKQRSRAMPAERRTPVRAAHRGASRALDVLEFLCAGPDGFTLAELSRRLGVPKSSLLALLRTFVERGYLEHQPTGLYRVGSRAMEIGLRAPGGRELPALARPILVELANKSGESAFLGVYSAAAPEVVYVDKVESHHRIRYTAELGERRPLYCTAPGLAVLAFLPDAERDKLTERLVLTPYTELTVTDRTMLRARLDDVRRAGVAVNVDEFIAGAAGIAAPVFDRVGAPIAACTVIGPTSRLLAQKDELSRLVKTAADAVSLRLGFGAGRMR